jgi:hypothetical protein
MVCTALNNDQVITAARLGAISGEYPGGPMNGGWAGVRKSHTAPHQAGMSHRNDHSRVSVYSMFAWGPAYLRSNVGTSLALSRV